MKKFLTCVFVIVLVLCVGSTSVFASGGRRGRRCASADVDRQPVCGYYNTDNIECKFVDEDGDGFCDTCGQATHRADQGCGTAYVDKDGDGVCDNQTAGTRPSGSGLRRGCGRGRFCK